MKKLVGLVIVAGVLASAGIAAQKTGKVPEVLTSILNRFHPTEEEGVITASGNVEITEVNVGFTLAGRVQELFFEEGQPVQKGAILARLDNAELTTAVMQNQAVLDEAVVRLQEVKTGSRSQQIQQAEASVAAVVAELDKATKDLERANALYKQNLIPVSQLDAANSAYNAATARHQQALEQLSLLKEGPTKETVRAAEYKIQQARAGLQASQERLNNTILSAPMDGIILKKNTEVGEILTQGTSVYTIGDLEHPWIKVYVKEDKLGLVKLGQKAEVRIDSFPNKVYAGAVTYISSEAEFTPKTVQTKEERVKLVFGVKVKVENENSELKPGMPADVKIVLK